MTNNYWTIVDSKDVKTSELIAEVKKVCNVYIYDEENIDTQLVSLELARKLKDLKVKQKSYFYYLMQNGGSGRLVKSIQVGQKLRQGTGGVFVSAFTVAELGEMLPKSVRGYSVRFYYVGDSSFCGYFRDEEDGSHFLNSKEDGSGYNVGLYADTEADARAKMLIYLLENKLILL